MDPRTIETARAWLRDGHVFAPQDLTQDPEKDALALKVQACFQLFPEVAELLMRMTLFRPPVNYSLPKSTGEFDQYALLREGQNTIAAAFLDYLNHADTLTRRTTDAASQHDGAAMGAGDDGAGWGRFASPDFAIR